MSITPASKIEIWDTNGDPVYTTVGGNAIIDALTIKAKPVVTSSPGSFVFILPASKALTNVYDDIGLNYQVDISLGWGSSLTKVLTGKILKLKTQASKDGVFRVFEGKDLGEQLERTLKRNKRWQDTAA